MMFCGEPFLDNQSYCMLLGVDMEMQNQVGWMNVHNPTGNNASL